MPEGAKMKVTVNKYERSTKARDECIKYWLAKCSVCDLEFINRYGEIGDGFIHVHHKTPISKIGKTYKVDPIKDLIPVCPNCHAMIHKKNPPFTIEQLKEKLVK
jgi:5-methylcytosine-specific restriction protein A